MPGHIILRDQHNQAPVLCVTEIYNDKLKIFWTAQYVE